MCDDCTQSAYEWGERALEAAEQGNNTLIEGLETIADLHIAVWTQSRLAEGQALCNGCRDWWPCETFLTAVVALNDAQ